VSPVLVLVAAILAIGIWGYIQRGDVLYIVNKLSASDIAVYAANAGFMGDDLVTAIAIALAESGGDPQVEGDSGTSYGLWQIHWTVHPEFDKASLKDPQYNANAAFSLYQKRGGLFGDWSTYTGWTPNGYVTPPYLAHVSDAQAAVNA
jgi:Lysozyme like domain